MFLPRYLILITSLFFSTNALSSLMFDESVSGDIDNFPFSDLTNGLSTFDGSVSIGDVFDGDLIDYFVHFGSSSTVSLEALDVTGFAEALFPGAPAVATITWQLQQTDYSCVDLVLGGLTCTEFSGFTTIATNSYSIDEFGFVTQTSDEINALGVLEYGHYRFAGPNASLGASDITFDYRASVNVASVPVPGALVLFLSGFSLFIGLSRRRFK